MTLTDTSTGLITITPTASEKVKALLEQQGKQDHALRIFVRGMGCSGPSYGMALDPREVTVGDVYRVLEGEIAPVDCTAEGYHAGDCSQETHCLSRSVWDRVQMAILGVLDATTLADLVQAEQRRARLAGFVPITSLESPPTPTTVPAPAESRPLAHA